MCVFILLWVWISHPDKITLFTTPTIIAAFPSLISSFSHARVSCKLAAVYRVHRAPRVYRVSCRLTPGKPPGRRADGGRWGGRIGLDEEPERREERRMRSIHIFSAFEHVGITLTIVCPHKLIHRHCRNASWETD